MTRRYTAQSELDLPRVFSLPGMQLVRTLPLESGARVDRFACSDDGRFLAMSRNSDRVRIVDLASCP